MIIYTVTEMNFFARAIVNSGGSFGEKMPQDDAPMRASNNQKSCRHCSGATVYRSRGFLAGGSAFCSSSLTCF